MAFILKKPEGSSKGIIIFTHKERILLVRAPRPLASALRTLKETYVAGLHFGHYHENIGDTPFIDFYLAGAGTLRLTPGTTTPIITLGSRNFTPECYRNQHLERTWDILTVARPLTLKNIDQLFAILKKMYEQGSTARALLICPAPLVTRREDGWYESLEADYLRLFTKEERERVTLRLIRTPKLFPLSPEELSHIYNQSKLFALLSDKEGESRVIAEALLCGARVIVKKHLKGGGRDYLDEKNSIQFTSVDEGAALIMKALETYQENSFDADALARELREDFTKPLLLAKMQEFFAGQDIPWKGALEDGDYSRGLPGHLLLLPRSYCYPVTDDLRSSAAAYRFLSVLMGQTTSTLNLFLLSISDVERKSIKAFLQARHKTKTAIKYIFGL